jgi:CRP/FNR family transcriptional regulator, cyclic AMP receptor protein
MDAKLWVDPMTAPGPKSHPRLVADDALLARLELTRPLSVAARQVIARHGTVHRYAAGEVLWTAGAQIGHIAVVLDGRVRVTREGRGRQQVVHSEGPGGTLGEVPMFTAEPTPATATALAPTQCLILTRSTIERAMAADPNFAWLLLRRLADRVRHLVERLDRLGLDTARTRLADLLLRACESADSNIVVLGMTQTALAEELGTVREVVVRTLREFREARLIAPAGRGCVRLVNVDALRRLVAAARD